MITESLTTATKQQEALQNLLQLFSAKQFKDAAAMFGFHLLETRHKVDLDLYEVELSMLLNLYDFFNAIDE
jgi:hypothetical protein